MGNGRMLVRFPHDKKAATMSIKTYKYRIYANKTTTDKLYGVLNLCRELYNAALQERRDANWRLWIAAGQVHQHANPTHALGPLRLRTQRPGRHPADKCDEFTPSKVASCNRHQSLHP